MWQKLLQWAKRLKREAVTLWFCTQHPQTPWHAKAMAFLMVAYAFSPIDLIPDFIPILGYVDEAILLPIGIWLTLKLIPQPVITAARAQAEQWLTEKNAKPRSWLGAAIMIAIWIAFLWWAWRWYQSGTPF
jgi:uncharacterized membrane protein YkvA (DUF1232 family)